MTFFNRIPLNHHFFIEQFDYYTAFFGKLGKEIILFYQIMQFVYDFTSLATHSTVFSKFGINISASLP